MPLPKMTASALLANSSGCCASTTTPFIDVMRALGLVISAFQPSALRRFNRPSAMKESSSLNPSKVRMAMRIEWPWWLVGQRTIGPPAIGSLLEQRAQHPRGLLVHREALCQQVCRGLVARAVGQREDAACRARDRLVALDEDAHHLQCLGRLGGCILDGRQRTELRVRPRRRR